MFSQIDICRSLVNIHSVIAAATIIQISYLKINSLLTCHCVEVAYESNHEDSLGSQQARNQGDVDPEISQLIGIG